MFSNLKNAQEELYHLPPQSCSVASLHRERIPPGSGGSWEESRGARQIAAKSFSRGTEVDGERSKTSQARSLILCLPGTPSLSRASQLSQ